MTKLLRPVPTPSWPHSLLRTLSFSVVLPPLCGCFLASRGLSFVNNHHSHHGFVVAHRFWPAVIPSSLPLPCSSDKHWRACLSASVSSPACTRAGDHVRNPTSKFSSTQTELIRPDLAQLTQHLILARFCLFFYYSWYFEAPYISLDEFSHNLML